MSYGVPGCLKSSQLIKHEPNHTAYSEKCLFGEVMSLLCSKDNLSIKNTKGLLMETFVSTQHDQLLIYSRRE